MTSLAVQAMGRKGYVVLFIAGTCRPVPGCVLEAGPWQGRAFPTVSGPEPQASQSPLLPHCSRQPPVHITCFQFPILECHLGEETQCRKGERK